MYNYQTYLKEQELTRKFDQIQKDHNRAALHRQKSNPTLVHSHKKRIEGFILTMIDKPIPVTQHSNHPHAFRDEDRTKNLAANAFYLKHQREDERIKQSLQQNSSLDEIPFRNTFSHRFRELDRNSKGMKYKPINHNFRIKEYFDKQTLNYLPNSNTPKIDRLIHHSLLKNQKDRENINKTINKSLLPFLHAKTYFKSVQTLFAQLPIQRNGEGSTYQKQAAAEEKYEQGQIEVKRQPIKNNDHLSRKQNSKEALLKCNMLHHKEKTQNSIFHSQSSYTGAYRA